jgi:hypothetical protein
MLSSNGSSPPRRLVASLMLIYLLLRISFIPNLGERVQCHDKALRSGKMIHLPELEEDQL